MLDIYLIGKRKLRLSTCSGFKAAEAISVHRLEMVQICIFQLKPSLPSASSSFTYTIYLSPANETLTNPTQRWSAFTFPLKQVLQLSSNVLYLPSHILTEIVQTVSCKELKLLQDQFKKSEPNSVLNDDSFLKELNQVDTITSAQIIKGY